MNKYLINVLILVSIIAGNYFKFGIFAPEARISILDLTVIILSIYVLITKPKVYTQTPKSLLIFWGVCLLSLIPAIFRFGINAVIVGAMYIIRFMVYSSLFLALASLLDTKKISKLILLSGGMFTLIAALQYLFFPDIRPLAAIGWDEHYYRAVGTLLDPGFLGIILVFFLVYLSDFKNLLQRFMWVGTYIVFALTYSRSSFLAYFGAMGFLAYQKKSWKFLLGTWLLLAITMPLLPRVSDGEGVKLERTNSIQARIDNWRNSITIFAKNPILGVGFNTYRYAQRDYGYISKSDWEVTHAGAGADASLFFVLATTGIVGGIAYIIYLKDLWKINSLRPFLIPLFVHSFFLNSMFYPFVLLWLTLLIAKDYKLPSTLSGPDSPQHLRR